MKKSYWVFNCECGLPVALTIRKMCRAEIVLERDIVSLKHSLKKNYVNGDIIKCKKGLFTNTGVPISDKTYVNLLEERWIK